MEQLQRTSLPAVLGGTGDGLDGGGDIVPVVCGSEAKEYSKYVYKHDF